MGYGQRGKGSKNKKKKKKSETGQAASSEGATAAQDFSDSSDEEDLQSTKFTSPTNFRELQAMTPREVRYWMQYDLNIPDKWAGLFEENCIDGDVLSTYEESKFMSDFSQLPIGYLRKILKLRDELSQQKQQNVRYVLEQSASSQQQPLPTYVAQVPSSCTNLEQDQAIETPRTGTKSVKKGNMKPQPYQTILSNEAAEKKKPILTYEAHGSSTLGQDRTTETIRTLSESLQKINVQPQPCQTILSNEAAEKKMRKILTGDESGTLDDSFYPILVTNKPRHNVGEDEELKKGLDFVPSIKWNAVFDCDSKSDKNGLCAVVQEERAIKLLQPDVFHDDRSPEEMDFNDMTAWIFANGQEDDEGQDDDEAQKSMQEDEFEWNDKYRADVDRAVDFFLSANIPKGRAVIVFSILSNDNLEIMIEIFGKMKVVMQGQKNFLFLMEDTKLYDEWVELNGQRRLLRRDDVDKHSVVGQKWEDVSYSLKKMGGSNAEKVVFPIYKDSRCTVPNKVVTGWQNISVLSKSQCEIAFGGEQNTEFNETASKIELDFYKGNGVDWCNFYLSDESKGNMFNQVLRRECCEDIVACAKSKLKKPALEDPSTVTSISIFHQPGAGGSTCARQVLWDCRDEYRCIIVKKAVVPTVNEILEVRRFGYAEGETNFPPVIILMDNIDDEEVQNLRSALEEATTDEDGLACLILLCQRSTDAKEMAVKKHESFVVQHDLAPGEKIWFEQKYKEYNGAFDGHPENLIGFMLMKEECSSEYIQKIITNILPELDDNETSLLKYIAVISLFMEGFEMPVSCCDMFMGNIGEVSHSNHHFQPWETCLSNGTQLLLKQTMLDTQQGSSKAVKLVHPSLADGLVRYILHLTEESIGIVVDDFIFHSHILDTKAYLNTYLRTKVKQLLVERKAQSNYEGHKSKFSPLVTNLLEHEKDRAFFILEEASEKFKSSPVAQLLARLYLRDKDYPNAIQYSKRAIEYSPSNSYFLDTLGRVFIKQVQEYSETGSDEQTLNSKESKELLQLLYDGLQVFTQCQKASLKEEGQSQNLAGYSGELELIFLFLEALEHSVFPFNQRAILSEYLLTDKAISDIDPMWQEEREKLKTLSNHVEAALGYISDMLTFVKYGAGKTDGLSYQNNMLPMFCEKEKRYFAVSSRTYPHDLEQRRKNPNLDRSQVKSKIVEPSLRGIFKKAESNESQELKEIQMLLQPHEPKNMFDLKFLICVNFALSSIPGENGNYGEVLQLTRNLNTHFPTSLYGAFFRMLLLWPRSDFAPSNETESTLQAVKDLKKVWNKITKNERTQETNGDKSLPRHGQRAKAATHFFLGKGKGLGAFVHEHKLNITHAQLNWKRSELEADLVRLEGTFKDRDFLWYKTPSGERIHVRMSRRLPSQPSQGKVTFFLGFSFAEPLAYEVRQKGKENLEIKRRPQGMQRNLSRYEHHSGMIEEDLEDELNHVKALTSSGVEQPSLSSEDVRPLKENTTEEDDEKLVQGSQKKYPHPKGQGTHLKTIGESIKCIETDEKEVSVAFDHKGGKVYFRSYDVTLQIPPNTLTEGASKMTFKVLTETPPNLKIQKAEVIVSFGFYCETAIARFRKPFQLTMPHCAVLRNPARVKTVLYVGQDDGGEISRTELSKDTCIMHKNTFDLFLDHFSWWWPAISWGSKACEAIKMWCMPYLPRMMPENRQPVLVVTFFIHVNGNKPDATTKSHQKNRPVLDDPEELTLKSEKMSISYELGTARGNSHGARPASITDTKQSVSHADISKMEEKKSFYFDLDFDKRTDSELITLRITPPRQDQPIKFTTDFERKQDAITGALAQVSHTSANVPREDTGHISGKRLRRIARDIGGTNCKLIDLGLELDFKMAKVKEYLATNRIDGPITSRGTLEMLCDWQERETGNHRQLLYDALFAAGLGEHAEKYLSDK